MTFRAKRRDANEVLIVDALRAVGAFVQRLDIKGGPDLMVGYQGSTTLIEVKNPNGKRASNSKGDVRSKRGAFTADQIKWRQQWQGAPVVEVVNADEALVAIGALRRVA